MTTSPIRLGLMPPLTGLVSIYGPEITRAARIACDEINERGGVLGQPLELIVEDDGSLPDSAVPAANRLLDDHGCVALIGNLLSNSRIAVSAMVSEPRRVPMLNFSFYEGSISSRYFFHFAALPNQQIDKMIPFMTRRFGLKMFFAGNNYEWPRGSIDAAMRSLASLGGETIDEVYLPIGADPQSIDALLQQVKRSGADVFVPYFAGNDQIQLLTRFTEMGLKEHITVVMGHYDEIMASHLSPEVRQGFYSSNSYFMTLSNDNNRRYLQRLRQQAGVDGLWPNGNGILTNFGEGAYLCVRAFAQAAEAASSVEAEALVAALEQVRLKGPQGTVVMDAATHHASVNAYLAQCQADGRFTIVEEFGLIAPRIPPRYRATKRKEAARTLAKPVSASVEEGKAADSEKPKTSAAYKILSIADMGIIATDAEGVITAANRNACEMFGYDEAELLGLSVHLLLPPHYRQSHQQLLQAFVDGEVMEKRMAERKEVHGYRKDGSFFDVEASLAKHRNDDGEWILVVSLRDVTALKEAREALVHQATHDPLTGLPNRMLIRERLGNALERSKRYGFSLALLFVDLDNFKPINDTHGHQAGDRVLQEVAARLLQQVRPGDTVARLAGDEFVVLCEQIEQPAAISVLADRINDALRLPIVVDGPDLFVSASIGIAIGSGNTHSAEDLLRYADTAMYAVKQKGRDSWQFFSESLQIQAQQKMDISNGLRLAIERRELSARYQPIVEAESGIIVGAELLLRWHPAGGAVSPAHFIPVAELTGSIVPIGLWVFRAACEAQVRWRAHWGESAPYLSVNLSTRQLGEASLVEDFQHILDETGADPESIVLEVTETALMADIENNLRRLRQLHQLGLRVAVDDFGTGFSSLAQLTHLPLSVLKIDRAFIDGLEKSAENRAVVRSIIGLGHELGLRLVAEGVEEADQRDELCSLGCHLIQGYYFYRPLEEPDFIERCGKSTRQLANGDHPSFFVLAYVSEASVAFDDKDLASLIEQAESYNRQHGLTGCLLFRHGYFMQLLEGKASDVAALFDKIQRDPRHRDVRLIFKASSYRRLFSEWGMMLKNLDEPVDARITEAAGSASLEFPQLAQDPELCYQMLVAYRDSRLFTRRIKTIDGSDKR